MDHHPHGALAYASWILARMGGWTGYYGKPGPIVMLRRWHKFRDAKYTINLMQNRAKLGN